jgi:hypothetical protein
MYMRERAAFVVPLGLHRGTISDSSLRRLDAYIIMQYMHETVVSEPASTHLDKSDPRD